MTFPTRTLGKAIPYGVYDLANNQGWVSVGIDHDTAQFACASIRRWWNEMGQRRFPRATELMITADGGGSNSSRNRLWKKSLQGLADELGTDLERLPLSAGHQQVEQDRASAVLLHYQKLAWASADDLRSHRQSDRQHHHEDGPDRSRRVGPTPIRNRDQSQRRGTRTPPPHASKIPRRMELHDQTATLKIVKVIFSPCLTSVPTTGWSPWATRPCRALARSWRSSMRGTRISPTGYRRADRSGGCNGL